MTDKELENWVIIQSLFDKINSFDIKKLNSDDLKDFWNIFDDDLVNRLTNMVEYLSIHCQKYCE